MSNGIQSQVSFAKESSWGQAVTPDKTIKVNFSGGIKTDIGAKSLSVADGSLVKNKEFFKGQAKREGEFEMPFYPDLPIHWIYAALGGVTTITKAGETIVKQHTLIESDTKPSYTIEQVLGEMIERYSGVCFSGFKISAKVDEEVKVSFPGMAKAQATSTAITPATQDSRSYNFKDLTLKLGGVQVIEVSSVEFEYKNNMEFRGAANNSNDPAFKGLKGSEASVKLEMYLDATTLALYQSHLTGAYTSLDIVLAGDTIGSASNNGFTLTLPKAFYKTNDRKLADDLYQFTLELEGVKDPTTGKLISALATNLVTAL